MYNSNYDKYPFIEVYGHDQDAVIGYEQICARINKKLNNSGVLVIDCYHSVRVNEIVSGLRKHLNIDEIIFSDDLAFDADKINDIIDRNLTDDRVFGLMSHHQMNEFFDDEKLKRAKKYANEFHDGILLIIGVGASLITDKGVLVYADLARWEIQKRIRSQEIGNWKQNNQSEDFLRKYKRCYFVEWRVADRHKQRLFERIDFLLDTNDQDTPKMITKAALFEGLNTVVKRPFRLVPLFDPGVWGGQWMKEVCDLDQQQANYAWCFDCIPEENSLILKYGDIKIEIPAIDLVLLKAKELLGNGVHARFGNEFPIRFDLLDTIKGQNLSLQVHPLTEYIQEMFGMHYTQDESYYILDAKEDACVYLGVKSGIDKECFLTDLERSQNSQVDFNADFYINKIPAKKHDHFLIPAGTIHCSGANTMVLEISATPYIFTFKLWDWGRLGLDGLPRPIHLEHAKHVIQFDRDTKWVNDNLVDQVELLKNDRFCKEERTGLHQREFIETRRHWFTREVVHYTNGSVNVLNLIEGKEAIVESVDDSFEPFIVHYAETFIIPEAVKAYRIRPHGESDGKQIATIKAYVRL